jgi:hypothetical protein
MLAFWSILVFFPVIMLMMVPHIKDGRLFHLKRCPRHPPHNQGLSEGFIDLDLSLCYIKFTSNMIPRLSCC